MRILMLSHFFYPHVGGVEKHVAEISTRLIKKGHKVSIITENYDNRLKPHELYQKINIFRIKYPKIKYFGLFFVWYRLMLLRKQIIDSDIIHTHDVFIWYLPFVFLFPKKRVYTTFHGWEGIYPIPKRNILLNRIAAFFSKKVLCAGKFIEKHYGIKADFVYYTAISKTKNVNYEKDKKGIVYVGRLDKDTGLLKILNALSYLDKTYNIHFCGGGPLRAKCQKIGTVHGFVDPTEYYKRSSVCISAGLTSILEALSYKCRVITTYNNPLKKDYLLLTPFRKWIDVKSSPLEMAETIKKYLKDPEVYEKEINSAYKWVATQTWDFLTNKYLYFWGKK